MKEIGHTWALSMLAGCQLLYVDAFWAHSVQPVTLRLAVPSV